MSTSDLPTERTPLVDRTDIYQKLPYLLQIERSIYDGHGPGFTVSPTTITQSIAVYSAALPSEAAKTALTLLLYLRCLSGSYLEKASGDRSRLRISRLAECTVQAWKELDSEEAEVLHQILWMPFPIDEGNEGSQTVIEAILTPGCPLAVALDDRVASSLLKLWDHGQPSSADDAPVSTLETLITRVSTPRIFHLMELVSYTAYLWIYANYILDPPYHSIFEGQPSPDWRSYILTFYAASRILKDTWRPAIPFYCTVLAFATTLPSTPESGDFSYTLMLLSFFLHVIQSHMPLPPSPVMLMPRTLAVPLSAILHNLFSKIIVPAFLFFLPACLLSFFLVSLSISDIFLWVKGAALDPAPSNARVAFLMLFLILIMLSFSLITSMILFSVSHPPDHRQHSAAPQPWNTYGPDIDLSVRRHYFQAASTYSLSHYFPTPFNLLWIILVRIPCWVLSSVHLEHVASRVRGMLEPAYWITFVFPLALILKLVFAL